MAIVNAVCTSFKVDILSGLHTNNDVYKIALYDNSAILDSSTTEYTTVNEVIGNGYFAGGVVLSGYNITIDANSVILNWTTDPSWPSSTITAHGALIYNSSKDNKAVCTIGFGGAKSTINGLFKIVFPPPTSTTGLVVLT